MDSGRAARLNQDIADQVAELEDVELAMDEVYGQRIQEITEANEALRREIAALLSQLAQQVSLQLAR